MSFEFGDVVLVPFPFTSHAASKRRPAVVVSASDYARLRADVVLMPITSQTRPTPGDALLADWAAAGLLRPSAVKPVFATLEQALVIRPLGQLTQVDCAALRHAIRRLLG